MFIYFMISIFGHMLAHRLFLSMAREFAFSHQLVRHLSFTNLAVICIFTLISAAAPTKLWLLIGILLITLKFFPHILRILLLKRLRSSLIPLLDSVILGLQSGKSFRLSLQSAVDMQSGWVRLQLMELFESIYVAKNVIAMKSPLLKDFQAELAEIDRSQVRCVEQVRALRRHLKMQEDFRRRSGQVTQQIKMQAIIVTVLFCGLLSFVILQFGFKQNQTLILTSALVFISGLIGIFLMGRRLKWKV